MQPLPSLLFGLGTLAPDCLPLSILARTVQLCAYAEDVSPEQGQQLKLFGFSNTHDHPSPILLASKVEPFFMFNHSETTTPTGRQITEKRSRCHAVSVTGPDEVGYGP